MSKFFIALMSLIVGIFIIALIIVLKLNAELKTYLHIKGFAFIAIAIVSLFVVAILAYATINSSKDDKEPLGLPPGSVRALIAVLILIFYILISIAFSFSPDLQHNDVAKDILKTLGTLLIAVSAFYFGSKATEQGSKIAIDALNAKNNLVDKATDKGTDEIVPSNIIEEAIKTNTKDWTDKYRCLSIKAGKKKIDTTATTNDVDCIVFIVKTKPSPDNSNIPTTITYKSGDKTYNIPTDVQEEDLSVNPTISEKKDVIKDDTNSDSKVTVEDTNPKEINDDNSVGNDPIKG